MMTNAELTKLKQRLDTDLASATPQACITVGVDAFLAFVAKGWIVYKPFQPVGVQSIKIDLPTYNDHFASCDPRLPLDDAQVK